MRVVVVGSGLMGLLSAYYLRNAGADVCVLDRRDASARETSFANGGMLHASQVNPWNAPGILGAAVRMVGREDSPLLLRKRAIPRLARWGVRFIRESKHSRYAYNTSRNARLAKYSLSVMRELREQLDPSYDFAANGTLTIYREQSEFDLACELANDAGDSGLVVELLDREAAVAVEPALAPIAGQIVGASHFPEDESGDSFKFCQAVERACRNMGVEFHFNTHVRGFKRDGDRIESVEGESRRFAGDKFLLAAGSFSPLLSRSVGLRIPVQPVKGYSLTIPVGTWGEPPKTPVIDAQLHAAVCPLGDRLRVAGTAEFAGYSTGLTTSRIENLFNLLAAMYPSFEEHLDRAQSDRWTGLRPMTPAGVGIMGRTKVENLYLNTGHGHLGWTMAAGAAKSVASELIDGHAEFDLADYRLENH